MSFEDDHLDLLQNIEFAIVRVFHDNNSLLDLDAKDAISALVRFYQAEEEKRNPPNARLAAPAQQVFDSVRAICEWRLGRDSGPSVVSATTTAEITACLRRIQKSIDLWNKRGGRQGYLSFVAQYVR